jgi:hypothetical protein
LEFQYKSLNLRKQTKINMRNIIKNFKQTSEYEVLSEIFKLKRLGLAIIFNILGFASMYGILELYLIYKYGS